MITAAVACYVVAPFIVLWVGAHLAKYVRYSYSKEGDTGDRFFSALIVALWVLSSCGLGEIIYYNGPRFHVTASVQPSPAPTEDKQQ